MGHVDITVLVPTYNNERHIRSAIESAVGQTAIHQCQVIVSDDCSSDGTYELAQAAAHGHDRIVVRRSAHAAASKEKRRFTKLFSPTRSPTLSLSVRTFARDAMGAVT